MSDVLATYLLREQILKPDQVDDFLQLQVVMGGGFETHLLEAQVMSEHSLLRAMSEAYRMPVITREEIDEIPQKMPDIFPRVFAETYRMIPYRLIGRNLGVLVAEQPDETAVMKLEQRLKIRIMPAVTNEPRIYYAMQRLYGAEIPPRFKTLLDELDRARAVPKPKAAPKPAAPAAAAPAKSAQGEPAADAVAAAKPAEPVFQRERLSTLPERAEHIDLETALARLQLAKNRDQVIDVVLQFANNAFKFSSLFVLQGSSFVGYSAKGDPVAAARMSRVTVPIILQSMFKTVYETQGPYLGVVPEAGMNSAILEDLGRGQPKIVFLAPVVIRGKLTALIYCDNGKRGVASRKVADLLVIVTRLGATFQRLIQQKKAEVKVAANVVGDAVQEAATLAALAPAAVVETKTAAPSAEAAPPPSSRSPASEETFAPPLDETDMGSAKSGGASDSYGVEFKADEPTITIGDGHTLTPVATTDLLSQRFLNVLKAAEDEEDEEDRGDEESIDVSNISADALLGKEEPVSAPPPLRPRAPEPPPQQARVFTELDGETDEEEAQGWENVLVDTIAQGKQGGTVASAQDPEPVDEVGWEDMIVEAAQGAPSESAERRPRLDDLSVLLEAIDSPDEDVALRATESLWQRREELGDKFGAALGARFPGRLRIDPFSGAHLPPVIDMSPVLRLLVALGPQALNIVLPHLESQYPAHRLIATMFFGQVVSGHAFTKLLRRLFDEEPKIREAAADTLRRYARLPGYDEGLQRIRERLAMPVPEAQARACEILGRLRDTKSVPALIPLSGHKRPEIANTALGALMRITAQDCGNEPKAWTQWWVKTSDRPREEWLIAGLRRKEAIVRAIADEELRLLTGLTFNFDPNAKKSAQEPAIKGWESWWAGELRTRSPR